MTAKIMAHYRYLFIVSMYYFICISFAIQPCPKSVIKLIDWFTLILNPCTYSTDVPETSRLSHDLHRSKSNAVGRKTGSRLRSSTVTHNPATCFWPSTTTFIHLRWQNATTDREEI